MVNLLKDLVSTGVVLFLGAVVVAWIMEFIKHQFYSDEITKKQAEIWAFALSLITTATLYFGLKLIGEYVIMLLYFVIIYLGQREVDMRAVRPFVKKYITKQVDKL